MSASPSSTDELASSLHRGVLGTLLAIVALLGVGLARGLASGEYLVGTLGLLLAVGAGYWILDLFREGLQQRN
jgi:hypothetical protein